MASTDQAPKRSGSGLTKTPFSDAVCKPKGGTASPAPANPNQTSKK